jgi:DNA polymerase-3 subunit delta'
MWNIIGQPKTIALLERGLEKGNLSHAYLFVGPRHVGKTTLALDLAQALNCEATTRPCGSCSACTRIAVSNHPDVQVIGLAADKKTEVGIGQVKEMQHAAGLPPFEGKCKVFIIDDTESLSPEAANCLLKVLEEPLPQRVYILLATAENLVMPTVVSRCQLVYLHPVPHAVVKEVLVDRYDVTNDRAEELAHLSKGCPGWAISAIKNDSVFEERSEKLAIMLEIINADSDGRFSYAAELSNEFGKSRQYGDEILGLWLDWWRDLLLIKGGATESVINLDRESELHQQVVSYNLEQIKVFIQRLLEARGMIRQNVNSRLVLDTLMLSMPRP